MPMRLFCFALALALSTAALGQEPAPASAERSSITLTQDQIRDLIRQSSENDLENDKKQRNYTYVEREEDRRLDGKGQVKSTEVKTYDVMEIYSEQVQKLIAKDDKPLSEKRPKRKTTRFRRSSTNAGTNPSEQTGLLYQVEC